MDYVLFSKSMEIWGSPTLPGQPDGGDVETAFEGLAEQISPNRSVHGTEYLYQLLAVQRTIGTDGAAIRS